MPELLALLERLHRYQPELPEDILSQATGMQGDRTRLENFIMKLIRGAQAGAHTGRITNVAG